MFYCNYFITIHHFFLLFTVVLAIATFIGHKENLSSDFFVAEQLLHNAIIIYAYVTLQITLEDILK